MIKEALG